MKLFNLLYLCVFVASAQIDITGPSNNFYLKSFQASIRGGSSLHDWKSEVTELTCQGDLQLEGGRIAAIKNVVLTIPVSSIKSKEGKIMDKKTYAAFKYETNPNITYKGITNVLRDSAEFTLLQLTGTLSMAGISRPVNLYPKAKRLSNGDFAVSTLHEVDMTDYSMDPPTALLGTIVVRKKVTINIELIISKIDQL